jgi:hypothetical protein
MPILPWSARGGIPPVGDPAYDALLDGHPVAKDVAQGLRPVAEAIAALNGEPETRELDAEAGALAVFRGGIGMSAELARSRRRRRSLLASLLSAKLAAVAAAAAVTLGGVAAAAYAGALPASIQKLAHDTLGAPAAHRSAHPAHSAVPVGPSATGSAAYGLCTAYAHLTVHGSTKQKAVAFRNLAAAAGGAANVAAYCAKVAHPGTSPVGTPTSHPTGKPTALPSPAPTSHPTGQPSTHPTGQPSTHPTGKSANSP